MGSSSLYVPTVECTTNACAGRKLFSPAQSPSYVRTNQTALSFYDTGGATGFVSRDVVSFGGRLSVANVTFLAATVATYGDLETPNLTPPSLNVCRWRLVPLTAQPPSILGLAFSQFGANYTNITVRRARATGELTSSAPSTARSTP